LRLHNRVTEGDGLSICPKKKLLVGMSTISMARPYETSTIVTAASPIDRPLSVTFAAIKYCPEVVFRGTLKVKVVRLVSLGGTLKLRRLPGARQPPGEYRFDTDRDFRTCLVSQTEAAGKASSGERLSLYNKDPRSSVGSRSRDASGL